MGLFATPHGVGGECCVHCYVPYNCLPKAVKPFPEISQKSFWCGPGESNPTLLTGYKPAPHYR